MENNNNQENSHNSNYDVLELANLAKHPFCKHGPSVLFSSKKKQFYSCAACRDHKVCSFYAEYNADKPVSGEKMKVWFERYKDEFDAVYQENTNMYNHLESNFILSLLSFNC